MAWKLAGSDYCGWHGGRNNGRSVVRTHRLPRFYSRRLTRTLSEAVEAALAEAPDQQLQLLEELALFRTVAADSVGVYSAAVEALEQADDERAKKLRPFVDQTAAIMRDNLLTVVSVCESAAKVHAIGKDKISVHNIRHVIDQVVRCAYDAFDGDDRVREFETMIREHVLIDDQRGTSRTPDQDVAEMDGSVPRE